MQSQTLDQKLVWLTGIQGRGMSQAIVKTDHKGNTFLISLYRACEYCFIRIDGDTILEKGEKGDYLILMKIDEEGKKSIPVVIPTSGVVRINDFDINLNNELIVLLYTEKGFNFLEKNIDQGYSILNISSGFKVNWAKSLYGFKSTDYYIEGNSVIYSSQDQLSINSENDIVFLGSIPTIYTEEIIDTIIYFNDTFFVYDSYVDTFSIDGKKFYAKEKSNFLVTSLNYKGEHKWTKVYQNDLDLFTSGLAINQNDEIGIIGRFSGNNFNMESDTFGDLDTTNALYAYCMFAGMIDKNGKQMWANRYYQNANPKFITFDNDGDLLISSNFYKQAFMKNDIVTGTLDDILLIKIKRNGTLDWRKKHGDSNTNNYLRVKYNSDGEIIGSGGQLFYPSFLFKFDKNGEMIEKIRPKKSTNIYGLDIDFTPNGTLISSGSHLGNLYLGTDSLPYYAGDHWGEFIAGYRNVSDTIKIDSFLGAIETKIDSSLCNSSTGSIVISSTIGMSWFSVLWSNGDSTLKIINLKSGDYSVTITDIYNNQSIATFNVPNFNIPEVIYNGIDDDCSPLTLDDDLDGDGFPLANDCNDTASEINPNAVEIPNNNVDENCDGLFILSSSDDVELNKKIYVYPNPANHMIKIETGQIYNFITNLYNINGQLIFSEAQNNTIQVSHLTEGIYLVKITELNTGKNFVESFIIKR